ncbi:FxSxx-COOH protein [Streptomyces sp. ID05-26A]|nr:FxSxx-COOH protein [Streptomyces sp. ID05-26A]
MTDDDFLESELLDVTHLNLSEVDAMPDSALRASLRRILTQNPEEHQYAAFQSAL